MTALVLVTVVAIAAAVQAVSGFGFALVAAPVLVALTDPPTAVSVLAGLGVVLNLVTLAGGGDREVQVREASVLVAWALPGVLAGAWLITRVPDDAIRVAVGVLVLAALGLRHVRAAPHGPMPVVRAATGLTSGALTTATGMNGPPLVLYLTARRVTPRALRDTLAAIFVVLGLAGLVALAATGALTFPGATTALALPAVVAGGLAGHRLHDLLPERIHGRITTAILLGAALTALASAV